ncbi:hypothetical protein CEQ25_012130 [Enterococcus faecalis]|nr:hypothetical protein CEQ25_012130 [Enterococcus faecalis]
MLRRSRRHFAKCSKKRFHHFFVYIISNIQTKSNAFFVYFFVFLFVFLKIDNTVKLLFIFVHLIHHKMDVKYLFKYYKSLILSITY